MSINLALWYVTVSYFANIVNYANDRFGAIVCFHIKLRRRDQKKMQLFYYSSNEVDQPLYSTTIILEAFFHYIHRPSFGVSLIT